MASNPRRTHRKRVSALRLSSDTTSTLPEYIPVNAWQREHDNLSDRPPDYPDSAEEADEDTDTSADNVYVPPPLLSTPATSPRRQRRFTSHRRRHSTATSDPYLDSLLARSVHALEMSNTLLQSSMSTHTSLSTILGAESQVDEVLESSARGLSIRIQGRDMQSKWAEDLAAITREVDTLLGEDPGSTRPTASSSSALEPGISSSLPSSSPSAQLYKQTRRPSLLDLRASSKPQSSLHLSYQDRSSLVSPPPRALTQYVASTSDPDAISLPSTLGLRVPPSSHLPADRRPHEASTPSLHAALSSPQITDKPIEHSTPAYNMLASFVIQNRGSPSGSLTPSTSFIASAPIPSFLSTSRKTSSPNTSTSTERSEPRTRTSPAKKNSRSPETCQTNSQRDSASRSVTPKQILSTLPHRPMTPPTEESSYSSSDSCLAKRTVLSLRKILDEQPAPPLPPPSRPPAFLLPRTPAPVAEAGTSTATASISRLFTKSKHTSSTRSSSPPRHSAMKQPGTSSSTGTPSPSPTVLSIPDLLNLSSGASVLSTSSSGRSTPKRISFAELPESYAESRPGGSSARFRDKHRRSKGKARGKGKDKDDAGGWLSGWLVSTSPGATLGSASARHSELTEDRLSRTWGGRMTGAGFGSSGLDEWAL